MPFVDVKRGRMQYACFGSGSKALVVLPGLSLKSLDTYADSVESAFSLFSKEYRVYVFDRLSEPDDDYTVYAMADDTAEAVKKLGLSACCVFGASQGGMLAQCMALKYPELVSELALGSTCCRMNDLFENTVREWGSLAKEKDEEALNHAFVYKVYSEKTLEKFGEFLVKQNIDYTDAELKRFERLDMASLGFDVYNELKNIKCPTLVLGAGQDRVIGVQGSYEIAEQIGAPLAQLFVYENYGHAVYDEAPDYRQRLKDFFDSNK